MEIENKGLKNNKEMIKGNMQNINPRKREVENSLKTAKGTFQRNYNERGITLVALVITIVILIILAVVAINAVFGDSGLLKYAQDAKNYQSNADVSDAEMINDATSYIDGIISGNGGTGENPSGAKTLVQAFKDGDIAVGDYVNYTPTAGQSTTVGKAQTGYDEPQTFTVDTSTTWRVLGLSEDGNHLLLTSGSPIKKDGDDPYLVLQGAEGYLYCENTLDTIAGIYNNSELADETRSMRIEDIERVLGDMTVEYPNEGESHTGKVYFTSDESKTNIGETTPYPSYTYEAIYDYTPEGAIKSPAEHAPEGEKVTGDAYMFTYTTEDYETRADYVPQRVYDMLFADTTESKNYAKSYWLASPGVYAYSAEAGFGAGVVCYGAAASGSSNILFYSGDSWYAFSFAVRPVVSLKSDITIEQIQKIEDQTEATWTTEGGKEYGSGRIS